MKRDRKKEIRLKAFVLEFYCKLILMEMSHSSLRQKEIISKEGVDLLLSLQDFHTPEHQDIYRHYFITQKDRF